MPRYTIDSAKLAQTDWQLKAKCRGDDVEKYDLSARIPMERDVLRVRQQRAAELCKGCPVMKFCALDTLDRGNAEMVRAGLWFTYEVAPLGLYHRSDHFAKHPELMKRAGIKTLEGSEYVKRI